MKNLGLQLLANEVFKEPSILPIQNLEADVFYYYKSSDEDMFSKSFVFQVLEEKHDHYIIEIEKQFKTILNKDFDLIEAVNYGKITRLGKENKKETI